MNENIDEKQILVFRVGPVVCCVDAHLVDSIVHPQPLHRFPRQADFILGVLQYQNTAVSIVNLFHKFDLEDPEPIAETRYVMGQTAKGTAGFWVDEVLEVTEQFEVHSAKPPEYTERSVFECTILWRDKLVLKTDFTQLFMMSDARPLKNWIEIDAGNAIAANYPNSTIAESDINAWAESVSESSDQKIQALMSRGVEFSQMVTFDKDDGSSVPDVISEDERPFNFVDEEAMTVSPLTELSGLTIAELPNKVEKEFDKEIIISEPVDSTISVESTEENQVMEGLAAQHGDLENTSAIEKTPKKLEIESSELIVENNQTILENAVDQSSQSEFHEKTTCESAQEEPKDSDNSIEDLSDMPVEVTLLDTPSQVLTKDIKQENSSDFIIDSEGSSNLNSQSLNSQKEYINPEVKTEINNLRDDDEVVEAIADQYNDSKEIQQSEVNIDEERLDTTKLQVEESQAKKEKSEILSKTLQKNPSEDISEAGADQEITQKTISEPTIEIQYNLDSTENVNFENEISSGFVKNSIMDVPSKTLIEPSADFIVNVGEGSKVSNFSLSELDVKIDAGKLTEELTKDSTASILEDNSISQISKPFMPSKIGPSKDKVLTDTSVEINSTEFLIDTSDIEVPKHPSIFESELIRNRKVSVSDNVEEIEEDSVTQCKFENVGDSNTSVIDKSKVENKVRDSEVIADITSPSEDADDEKNTVKALAAQYGDTIQQITKKNVNENPQNQIKQSQPDVFDKINNNAGDTVIRHGFAQQSKADQLTLAFISKDLTETKIDVDLDPLTNLYTEFLNENAEEKSTELLLKGVSRDSDIESKNDLSNSSASSNNVNPVSLVPLEPSNSTSEIISQTEKEQSVVEISNFEEVISISSNFNNSFVEDDQAKDFGEDLNSHLKENIETKENVNNQTNKIKSSEIVEVDEEIETGDAFLDSLDEFLDSDAESFSQEHKTLVTQDKAVGKVIERIERKRNGKGNTSPARVVVSILASAIIVFFVQHYWLNPTEEDEVVPSLELLVESSIDKSNISDSKMLNNLNEEGLEVEAFITIPAEIPERYTETPTNAIGSVTAKNAVSNKNLESVFSWKKHLIIRGDTLWALSKRYLNDPFRYTDLARWSNIKNPDKIYPGNEVSYNVSEEAKKL